MAKLTDEEKAQLEALTSKANAHDDEDEDFDVEWWEEDETGKRRGGRVPWKTGKGLYGKYFPDLFGSKSGGEGEGDQGKGPGKGGGEPLSKKYFGRGSGQE